MSNNNSQPEDKNNSEKKPIESSKPKSRKEKDLIEIQMAKGWMGTHRFAESIILDGKPVFLYFDTATKQTGTTERVDLGFLSYVPLEKENYGYEPYSFSSDELKDLLNTNMSKEDLLSDLEEIVQTYLVTSDEIKDLVIGDLFLSYCQEWIKTVHFLFAVGETESGKSTLVYLFKLLGYRCLYGTNIPPADVYNFLGTSEEGAGTIAEDEAQDISFERKKIRLYKNSYSKGSRQPIIDMKSGRRQTSTGHSVSRSLQERGYRLTRASLKGWQSVSCDRVNPKAMQSDYLLKNKRSLTCSEKRCLSGR